MVGMVLGLKAFQSGREVKRLRALVASGFVFFMAQVRANRAEGTLNEKMPPSDWLISVL